MTTMRPSPPPPDDEIVPLPLAHDLPGLVVIICGPSGAGKSTIAKALVSRLRDHIFSVSATTRAPRPGETEGVDYHFLTGEGFGEWVAGGRFLEHATYQDNRYGTLADQVTRGVAEGHVVLLDIDVQGMQQLVEGAQKLDLPLLTIFVSPPSFDVLAARLSERATEPGEVIEGRLAVARREMALAPLFDEVVVNDKLEDAIEEVRVQIESARSAV